MLGPHHRARRSARAAPLEAQGYRFSYDMLGERGADGADADRYFERYSTAIEAVGQALAGRGASDAQALMARPGVSVKLSALHPRFEPGKEERLMRELLPRLVELAAAARAPRHRRSPSTPRSRTAST